MITRLVMLDGVEHTVITPIVNTIIDDISSKIFKDPDIFLNKSSMYEQENSEVPDNVYVNDMNGTVLDVDYEVTENEELRVTTSTHKPINRGIILDRDTGFSVRPNYVSTDIRVTFKYRTQYKNKMHRILNKLKSYYASSGYTFIHSVSYSYLLPATLMELITEIATLRGYADVDSYIAAVQSVALDKAVKRGSDRTVPSFRGKQANIIGTIPTMPSEQTISKDGGSEYSITFEHVINIQQPIALSVRYPMLVNNQKINDKWIPARRIGRPLPTANGVVDIATVMKAYASHSRNFTDIVYHIPDYDQFVPGVTGMDKDRIKLFSILLEVSPTNPNKLFNIDDLGYVGVPSYIIDYLKAVTGEKDLVTLGLALFHIELYEGNHIRDYGLIKTAANDLEVETPLDISGTYHLLINVIVDVGLLYFSSNPNSQEYLDALSLLDTMNMPYYNNRAAVINLPDKAMVDNRNGH